MLSILCVRLTIKVKVGIPENFKVGGYPPKKTGSSHLNYTFFFLESRLISNFEKGCFKSSLKSSQHPCTKTAKEGSVSSFKKHSYL